MNWYKIAQVEELAPIEEKPSSPLDVSTTSPVLDKKKVDWKNIDWEHKTDQELSSELNEPIWYIKFQRRHRQKKQRYIESPVPEKEPEQPEQTEITQKEENSTPKDSVSQGIDWASIDWKHKSDKRIAKELGVELWLVEYKRNEERKRRNDKIIPFNQRKKMLIVLPEAEKEKVIEDFKNHMSILEISKKFNRGEDTIKRTLRLNLSEEEIQEVREEGERIRSEKFKKEKKTKSSLPKAIRQQIVDLFRGGVSIKNIGFKLKLDHYRVRMALDKELSPAEIKDIKLRNLRRRTRHLRIPFKAKEDAAKNASDFKKIRGKLSDIILKFYYLDGKTIEEIAEKLKVNMFILAKYLDEVEKDELMLNRIKELKRLYWGDTKEALGETVNWYKIAKQSTEPNKDQKEFDLSMDFNNKDQEFYEGLAEEMDTHQRQIIDEYYDKKRKKGTKMSWSVIPFARLKRIWEDYVNFGFVRDVKGLQEIEKQMLNNLTKLQAATDLAGHGSGVDLEELVEDLGYKPIDGRNTDFYFDFLETEYGAPVSDYGLPKLWEIVSEFPRAKTPEERLLLIDRMLNVVHQRGDLAALFVEGGSKSLSQLSGMGTQT